MPTHLPRSPGGHGPRLLLRRLLTSSLMSCYQPQPRPLAQLSSILPGLPRAPHLRRHGPRRVPPLHRHYRSVSPAALGGHRSSIHPRRSLLPHLLQTRPVVINPPQPPPGPDHPPPPPPGPEPRVTRARARATAAPSPAPPPPPPPPPAGPDHTDTQESVPTQPLSQQPPAANLPPETSQLPPLPKFQEKNQNEHESLPCNCAPWKQREGLCPMGGQCRQANVIYGASVKTIDILGEPVEESEQTYTGISYPVWKTRMYRHHTTFNNPAYRSETALADYIWDLQCPDRCYMWGVEECENSIEYEITWKILARAPGYNPITGMCRLCLKESFFILFHPKTASLNKKTEIFQGCKHKMFKFLADCKVT